MLVVNRDGVMYPWPENYIHVCRDALEADKRLHEDSISQAFVEQK
jgi:hypothetical protein